MQSYGPTYAFSVPCEKWELDLRDLPVKALSEESRAAFVAGNRFQTTLRDADRKITFRLLTNADERRMAALRRAAGERPITTLLGFRLDTIDGIEPREKQRFIEDLSMSDVTFLLGEFDRVDCGVKNGNRD